jgi:hypothetical protein
MWYKEVKICINFVENIWVMCMPSVGNLGEEKGIIKGVNYRE